MDTNVAVIKSEYCRGEALQKRDELPSLYVRGLMPLTWLDDIPRPSNSAPVGAVGALRGDMTGWNVDLMGGHWYGDGSGGEHSSCPELRRVAWSLVNIGDESLDFCI